MLFVRIFMQWTPTMIFRRGQRFHWLPLLNDRQAGGLQDGALDGGLRHLNLYAFWLSGSAPASAASAAAAAVSGVIVLPASACSAACERHGIGATAPITTRAD